MDEAKRLYDIVAPPLFDFLERKGSLWDIAVGLVERFSILLDPNNPLGLYDSPQHDSSQDVEPTGLLFIEEARADPAPARRAAAELARRAAALLSEESVACYWAALFRENARLRRKGTSRS